jgi:hypothetical protein
LPCRPYSPGINNSTEALHKSTFLNKHYGYAERGTTAAWLGRRNLSQLATAWNNTVTASERVIKLKLQRKTFITYAALNNVSIIRSNNIFFPNGTNILNKSLKYTAMNKNLINPYGISSFRGYTYVAKEKSSRGFAVQENLITASTAVTGGGAGAGAGLKNTEPYCVTLRNNELNKNILIKRLKIIKAKQIN